MAQRPKGGRISLTAFEAQWLYMVISTCGAIADDTVNDSAFLQKPKSFPENSYEAWDTIVHKVMTVMPDFDFDAASLRSQPDTVKP